MMGDFEFILPLNRSELKVASSRNQYAVLDVLIGGEIPIKLKDVKKSQHTNGIEFMIQNFDFFYSCLCEFESLNENVKCEIWNLAVKSLKKLEKDLVSVLENEDLEHSSRKKFLNLIKMTVYIFSELIDCFETEAMRPSAVTSKSKSRKKSAKKSYELIDWDEEKENGILILQELMKLNIKKLWEPPIIEESFINLISSSCFKVLENPATLKIKSLKEAIIALLALSIDTSRNSLGLSIKIIQMIQTNEHLATPLADAVQCFVEKHNAKNIVNVMIREIGLMEFSDGSQDASGVKSLSTFLAELAERIPDIVLQSITHLITFLNNDAYTMRNCTLTILGEIISKNLNKEGMEEKAKKMRDQFMDELEAHLHDVNAFVRSKVIQIWQRLLVEGVIPLCRQQSLLKLVSGRLQDKSSLVRKNAMFFITEFLKQYQLVARLSLEELQERLKEEQKKLKEMMPEDSPIPISFNDAGNEWKDIEEAVEKALKIFEPMDGNESDDDDPENEEDQLNKMFEDIKNCFNNENYEEGLIIFFTVKRLFKENPIFSFVSEDPLEESSVSGLDKDLIVLERIYKRNQQEDIRNDLLTMPDEHPKDGPIVNEVSKQQILVKWLEDCVLFSKQICLILPQIVDLLMSNAQTDILEAINFFVTAHELGVKGAIFGVKRFLPLIRSKETNLKEAVVTAFKRVFLNPMPKAGRSHSEEIVFGLSLFLQVLNLGEVQALEELFGEWMKNKELPKNVLKILWQKFSKQTTNDDSESHYALKLLVMAASTEPDVVKANLDHLIEVGLGERAEKDFLLAKDVCALLMKLGKSDKPKIESKTVPDRYPQDHKMFQRIIEILVSGFSKKDKFWTALCQLAIKFFYKLSDSPNGICVKLMVEFLTVIDKDTSEEAYDGSVFLISRLVTTIGEVAINHLMYLDCYVFNELKRRSYLKNEKQQAKEKRKKRCSAFGTLSKNKNKSVDQSNMDLELGLIGAEVDDTEADFIAKVCEEELLREDGMLGIFLPFVTELCSNPVKYPNVNLRAASSLTLGKLMLISSSVCENQLPLLVTILEKSVEPEIRGGAIILLRDLCLRFPNLLDPWTSHLYGRLKDNNIEVRKNTLAVLKDLILNDLIKVKSHMSDISLCLVDCEPLIVDSTNDFFVELSKRGNALYNVLPDIISHLSDPDVGTNEDNFRMILKTLLGLIEKDKQLEQLIEKLCLRFNSTRVERQDRDLAFCLSLLNYNERSLRKLQDNITCFAEKLRDVEIYEFFVTILNGSKKTVAQKTGSTALVDELGDLFEQFNLKGLDGAGKKLLADKNNKGKTTKTPRGRAKRKEIPHSSDSEEDNNYRKAGPSRTKTKERPKRSEKSKKKLEITFTSESES